MIIKMITKNSRFFKNGADFLKFNPLMPFYAWFDQKNATY